MTDSLWKDRSFNLFWMGQTLSTVGDAFTVTSSHLDTTVRIPNADKAKFQEAAEGAKAGCPISRLLNTKITLDAKLA